MRTSDSSNPDLEPGSGISRHLWTEAIAWPTKAVRRRSPFRSVQRLDRRDRDQVLHGIGEVPVERDQRVGVRLGQCDVLGVKGVRPPEQDGGFPRDLLEDAVPQQPDSQSVHVAEVLLSIPRGHFAAACCLVEKRRHLLSRSLPAVDEHLFRDH
jgi:hypothetical protein